GMRIGEPAALRVKDFGGAGITVREAVKSSSRTHLGSTKTDKTRTIPLAGWLRERLSALSQDRLPEAWLLPSPSGQMTSPRNWRRRVFNPAVKSAGLGDVQPQDLRHSASSLWAEL